jgi:hypothetical protein
VAVYVCLVDSKLIELAHTEAVRMIFLFKGLAIQRATSE